MEKLLNLYKNYLIQDQDFIEEENLSMRELWLLLKSGFTNQTITWCLYTPLLIKTGFSVVKGDFKESLIYGIMGFASGSIGLRYQFRRKAAWAKINKNIESLTNP